MSKSKKEAMAPRAITIKRTEISSFDDSYSFLKEKFQAEMQRMNEEMDKFSSNLMSLYGQQSSSAQPSPTSASQITWDALANSPLIQGEGNDKVLRLQFDFSTFDPADIRLELVGDTLMVSAHHEQKTDNSIAVREFKREFVLPRGVDPDSVTSSLSRDGVLTVQAVLPQLVSGSASVKGAKDSKVLSKNPQDAAKVPKPVRSSAESRLKVENPKTPTALTAAVPQSPLSTVSPASPQALPASLTSPTAMSPQKTSKVPSKTTRPAAK